MKRLAQGHLVNQASYGKSQSGETSSKTTDAPRLVDLQWNPDKGFFGVFFFFERTTASNLKLCV